MAEYAGMNKRLREAALVLCSMLAAFLLIALWTYDRQDPGWSYVDSRKTVVHNAVGRIGAWFADVFYHLFGYVAYLFPVLLVGAGMLLVWPRQNDKEHVSVVLLRACGFLFIILASVALADMHFSVEGILPHEQAGGILGDVLGSALVHALNYLGATLLLLAVLFSGITLATGLSWIAVMDSVGQCVLAFLAWGVHAIRRRRELAKETVSSKKSLRVEPAVKSSISKPLKPKEREITIKPPRPQQVALSLPVDGPVGDMPSIELLDPGAAKSALVSDEALQEMSADVEARLRDFDIEVKVVEVHPGPVITRFELELAPGMKVSRISNLAKDLARALSVISVRVVEVIPGKSVIGLEVPNEDREVVRLREVIASEAFRSAHSPVSLSLGKDISGNPVVVNLASMPHLLVAGTTGSGKSVGLNAMLLSLLYKSKPDEVRLIMIDPKMLELSVYDGIPHLLAPVVTNMKEAANALRWCVAEMERRYQLMASLGVRNLLGFNRKVKEAIDKGEPIRDPLWKLQEQNQDEEPATLTTLPFIVVVVDEFADMMMIVGKKVEELIARIAQKARAAGIHLILATQRPSVDVITGLIKANIPTRVAFQVSSKIDSRTILDQSGAEQLLGQGDMLYLPPGTGIPVRVHGAFVDDPEVHRVVHDWKRRGQPVYQEDILSGMGTSESMSFVVNSEEGGEQDELYDQAVRIVTETRKASISAVQRRLKIGYNRAARMIEEMEQAGVVSEMQSNGSREVLAPPPPGD